MTDAENRGKTAGSPPRGQPFVKGISGNPGGRPPSFGRLIREQTNEGQELVEFAISILRGKRKAVLRDRLAAMEWLADRGWGKSVVISEADITSKGERLAFVPDLTKLSAQELEALEHLVAKSTPDA